MKKKTLFLAVMVIGITMAASGTLAYFTAEDTAHNVITSGGVNIEVVEKTKGDNDVLVDFPEEGIRGVMPGSVVSKIVQVKNTGVSEAWIRVEVESTITNADGEKLPLIIGDDNASVTNYTILDGWLDGGDGYYYYARPVAADAFTGALFKEVIFNSAMGNEYQNCTANIMISAQAVQTANNGATVMEAEGWPADTGI